MKNLLAISIAAALMAPAAAMADTTLYGVLSASVGSVKTDNGVTSNTETVVESHASRLGVKGSTALDNGMEATYGLEYGVDLDGDAGTNGGASLTTRNQFVGLKGGFGEVRVGKHDTPHKLATAGLDNFADTYADSGVNGVLTERRVNNAVAYINKFGPVGVAVAHSTDALSVTAVGAPLADGADTNGGLDANSLMVNYSNGPWYAALGHETVQGTGTTGGVGKNTKVGVGYSAEAGHKVNLVYEKDSDVLGLTGDTGATGGVGGAGSAGKAWLLGGQYKMGNVALKAQVGQKKFDAVGADKRKLVSLGVDYSLGKKTNVYLLGHETKEGNAKDTATAVGIQTQF